MKPFLLILTFFGLEVLGLEIPGGSIISTNYKSFFITHSNTAELRRFSRKSKNCGSTIQLLNCDLTKPINLNPAETNKIKATYTQGPACDLKSTVFHWTVLLDNGTDLQFGDYYNKETFILEPYTIGAGSHHVVVDVTEYDAIGEANSVSSDICQFDIRIEEPVPQITGGSEITVSSGMAHKVDGSKSIDMSVAAGKKGDLQYLWSCKVEGSQNSDFCQKNLGTASSVVIPANYASDGLTYTFTLSVRTSLTSLQNTQQIIHFKKDAASIKIKCLKNCIPAVLKTNSKEALILEAVCEENCAKIKPEMHEWAIDDPAFDYTSSTRDGRNSNIFYVTENILTVGKKYNISVLLKGMIGGSTIRIEVHTPPKLDSCNVNPSSGEALKTKFVVTCTYKEGNYMFELYSVKNDLEVLLDRGVKLKDMEFMLSPGAKVKVKMIDDYRFSDSKTADVTVTPSLTTTNADELDSEIVKKYFNENSENSLDDLLKMKNFDGLIQAASSLIDELGNVKQTDQSKATIKKYQIKAIKYLEKIPMKNSNRARQVSAVVTKIVNENIKEPDPEIAALGTSICKKAARVDENRLKLERFPQSFSEEIKENTKVLSQCSQAGTTPNLEIMKTENTTEPPTPFPVLDVPAIVENYPDYVDDQNVSKFRQNFAKASNNLIDICFINTKTLEMTMVVEEDVKFVKSDVFNVTVMKEKGIRLPNLQITSHGIVLTPSKDFFYSESKVIISVCTTTKNPFWWVQQEEIQTSVAIVRFTLGNTVVNKFNEPFSITFEVNNLSPSLIQTHEDSTPRKPNKTMSKNELDFEKISLHRIDVEEMQGFTVDFSGLNDNDILDVAITDFYKPTYEEFLKIARRITKQNNTIHTSYSSNYDHWFYLGVLPNSKMGGNDYQYKFRVYTSTCYNWIPNNRRWQAGCQPTKTSSTNRIECHCYHSSTIAGKIVNNKVRKEETMFEELELEMQASLIIFVSVAVVFFLYCVLLLCLSINPKSKFSERTVYFLCDVPSDYRYGYLLIVKTANKMNAGTTSNVMVKLHGKKSQSMEHVLNFPDPEKKLLQKNQEDWFFMATERYLGDIEKIDLWFDSIGYRPTWYCSKIEVFDIQENKYWVFEINKRFEILNKEEITYTGYPDNPMEKMPKRKLFIKKLSDAFHGPHMWNIITYEDRRFSRIKRLTLMLSIFLTTYTVGLFLYGCPRLQNGDSLAYTTEYGLHAHVVLITIGCFIFTFAIHFPIIWFFRHSVKRELDNGRGNNRMLLQDVNFRCWCILIFIIILSITILVIFGFWVPHVTGLLWLTSIIVSLVIYIFLLENLVRMINNWMSKQETRVHYILNQVKSSVTYIEQQRSMLYKKFGRALLRPFLSHLYKPMEVDKIKERKYWAETKEKVLDIVEDLIMIMIYVVLLYLVILKDRDPLAYLSHIEVEELIQGVHSRTIQLEDIQIRTEFKDYLHDTLIFSMQSFQWYGKFVTKNPGMTIDNVNKYIGISRLRQHRSRNDTCKVLTRMNFITEVCYPGYSTSPEKRDFSEGWKNNEYSDSFARMDTVWKHKKALVAGTFGFVGKLDYYPGGGYIATLGRTMKNSIINSNYLFRTKWFDQLSRSIFIEFLMYSPNSNLFNSVTILFEFSNTGYIRSKLYVETAKLLFVREETGMMVVVIFIAFLVVVTVLATKIVYKILRKRKLVFKDAWHIVDILIILITVSCVLLYAQRSELVKQFLSKIETSKHNEFINYFHLLYAEHILTLIAAILVFVATLRLWKLLRFMLIIKIVEKTLVLSARPLLCLLLSQVLITLYYAFAGILLFRSQSYHFQNIPDTFATLLLLSLNFLSNFDLAIINTPIAYFYYSVYMIITLVYATIYVTVITICYGEAQQYYSNQEGYSVKEYIKEQYLYYSELGKVKWRKVRLRAGDEETNQTGSVYPKADEHRYADCLTIPLSKLKAMSLVSLCALRNMTTGGDRMTDKDADLIKRTVVGLFRRNSEKTHIFYMGNDEYGKVKLVDDSTLVKMERMLSSLLQKNKTDKKVDKSKQEKLYKAIIERNNNELSAMVEHLKALLDSVKKINIDE